MKKKLMIIFLAAISCFACVFALSACGNNKDGDSGDKANADSSDANGKTDGNNTEAGFENFEYTYKDGVYEITGVKDYHITAVVIPDKVTSIGRDAFRGCTELKTLVIHDGVTYIGYGAFEGCDNIENLTLPASAISSISQDNLKNVTITSGEIKTGMFSGGTSIKIGSDVTAIEKDAFNNCYNLESVTVDESNNKFFVDSGILYNKPVTDILCIPSNIAGKITVQEGVTSINCVGHSKLTEIIIPDGVTSVNFQICNSLESMTIPISVTSFDSFSFAMCNSLTEIHYGGTKAQWKDIKNMSNVFMMYPNLTIYCTDGNLDKTNYKDNSDSSSLIIDNGVTSIDNYAYNGNTEITSVTLPASLTSIGSYAFDGCSNITEIRYKGDVAGWCSISGVDQIMYYSNTEIKKLYINDKEVIGELIIPDGVTIIPADAFWGCSGITSITIPDSVTEIGKYAFNGCDTITEIHYGGTHTQWNDITKGKGWDMNTGNYIIYCDGGEQITKS